MEWSDKLKNMDYTEALKLEIEEDQEIDTEIENFMEKPSLKLMKKEQEEEDEDQTKDAIKCDLTDFINQPIV